MRLFHYILVLLHTCYALEFLVAPPKRNGSMVLDPLTFNLNDESIYPQEANMSLVQTHGNPMYNLAGFARLAGRLADNKVGKNGTLAERDDLYMELLGGLLASANIPVLPEEVHQQAQRGVGYNGIVANSTYLIDITRQFTNTRIRDTQWCENGFTYFDDQIKNPAIWSNNNLWFQNLEYYWSGIPWMLGNTSDLLSIAGSIQSWVSNASDRYTCNGFTYAVYDDQIEAGNNHIWIIGGAPWSSGKSCDSPDWHIIIKAIQKSLLNDRNRQVVGMCTHMTNREAWRVDIRIILATLAAECSVSPWDISCGNMY